MSYERRCEPVVSALICAPPSQDPSMKHGRPGVHIFYKLQRRCTLDPLWPDLGVFHPYLQYTCTCTPTPLLLH